MERVEIWTNGAGLPKDFVNRAQQAEQAGFDGITIVDANRISEGPSAVFEKIYDKAL